MKWIVGLNITARLQNLENKTEKNLHSLRVGNDFLEHKKQKA